MRIVITGGPASEPIDQVRFITNYIHAWIHPMEDQAMRDLDILGSRLQIVW